MSTLDCVICERDCQDSHVYTLDCLVSEIQTEDSHGSFIVCHCALLKQPGSFLSMDPTPLCSVLWQVVMR